MRRPLPYRPFIPAPRILSGDGAKPSALGVLNVDRLCRHAGIPIRVTSAHAPRVILHRGKEHWVSRGDYYVGLGKATFSRRGEDPLRVLEILAHSFHDYAAREAICGRGLFVPFRRRGRPPLLGGAMSAAERMRRMRERSGSRG